MATRWREFCSSPAWSFPFFAALTVIAVCRSMGSGCPPAARQVIDRQVAAAGQRRHFALDIENRGSRVASSFCHVAMQLAHLAQQFAHMTRAAAKPPGKSPLTHSTRSWAKQAAEGHQHQAHRTVAADEGFDAVIQASGNDILDNRVENNDRIVFRAAKTPRQSSTLPAAFARSFG